MTYFVPQSFLGYSTCRQRDRECVRLPTARVLTRYCVVANGLGTTAQTMCRVPTVADLFNTADDDFFHRV